MVPHRLSAVFARLAAESAVHRDAELVQVPSKPSRASPQPGNAVQGEDDAEVDARVADVEVGKRLEEALVLAA